MMKNSLIKYRIKILDVHDLEEFKAIRLEALHKVPQMFGSSYEVESKKPSAYFQTCLTHSTVFAAYVESEIVGIVTLTKESVAKLKHKAHLASLYVKPQFQNKGIANQLLLAVIQFCLDDPDIEQILLSVEKNNDSAIHLYSKFGFDVYGIEKQALKDDLVYSDELLMKRFI